MKKGDVFYIPAGLLHAIGKGIKVAEVQQNSNITYRVYDYHRQDANHNFRPLHIKQAEDVTGFMPPLQGHRPMGQRILKDGYYKQLLVKCPYFQVSRIEIETGLKKCGAMLGDQVEVGCNSVLNPGTVVGKGSQIYPVSCVRGIIPEDSIYKNPKEIVKKH